MPHMNESKRSWLRAGADQDKKTEALCSPITPFWWSISFWNKVYKGADFPYWPLWYLYWYSLLPAVAASRDKLVAAGLGNASTPPSSLRSSPLMPKSNADYCFIEFASPWLFADNKETFWSLSGLRIHTRRIVRRSARLWSLFHTNSSRAFHAELAFSWWLSWSPVIVNGRIYSLLQVLRLRINFWLIHYSIGVLNIR